MALKGLKTLTAGHRKALGLEDQDAVKSDVSMPEAAKRYYAKHPQLKGVPPHIVRKAWYTMAHLMLQPGAYVADMGCGDGAMTYVMAILNPPPFTKPAPAPWIALAAAIVALVALATGRRARRSVPPEDRRVVRAEGV